MAKYQVLQGESESALTLVDQAYRVAEESEQTIEMLLRSWDKARLLLQIGKPTDVLPLLINGACNYPNNRADLALLQAEAYLGLGNLSEAHDYLQQAITDIETNKLTYLRPRAEALLKRF